MFEEKGEEPAKKVMIGNIIFIGELYRKKLITHKIIHICLGKLLDSILGEFPSKRFEDSNAILSNPQRCRCNDPQGGRRQRSTIGG